MFTIEPKLVLKMLTKGIVPYLRGVGPIFAFALAVVASAAPLNSAVSTYGLPDNPAHQNSSAVVDRFLPLSTLDSSWEPVSAVEDTRQPAQVQSLVYSPDDSQESDDFNTVARHRGFRKFFLLVFVCGALIRFFTSPTFVAFITDALDPKSW
jgi:hypothetical protein